MSDPNGRVVDETSRDVILERARCIGIVTATLERLPGDSFVRSILLDLIEDMEARRLMPEKAGTTHGDS